MPACTVCSREIVPAAAAFCAHCGSPNPEATPGATGETDALLLQRRLQAALGDGFTVISATADETVRPRTGRVTVTVLGSMTPPNATMPPMRPPSRDGRRVYMGPDPRMMDSAMASSIDCNEPMLNSINPMHACWDERAASRDSVIHVPDRPGPDVCPRGVTGVGLLLQVSDSGAVAEVRQFVASSCPEFNTRVIEMARRLTFTPAQKGGHPVRAWVRLQIRGQPPAPPPQP